MNTIHMRMAISLFYIMIIALCRTVSPYVLYQGPKSWHEAQTYCRETNSDLATVVSVQDNALLLSDKAAVEDYAWIGLFDDMTKWKWSLGNIDHNSSHFSNWASSKPTYYPSTPTTRICVKMQTDGLWVDTDCLNSMPKLCFDGWVGYTFLNTPNTWLDSQFYCKTNYKDLASVQDSKENTLIRHEITKNAWIGLYRHTWTNWSDSTFSTFSNWDESMNYYLNTSAEFHCAMVNTLTGTWFRANCAFELPFICNGKAQGTPVSGGQGSNYGTVPASTGSSANPEYTSRTKLRLTTDANLNNAAIQSQILQQIHDKLEEQGLSNFKLSWTRMEKESTEEEEDDER